MKNQLNLDVVFERHFSIGLYRKYFKRPMDLIISFFSIIVLSPAFLTISILIKINLGSPIIFKQERPGLNEKRFKIYKFRTMTDDKELNGALLTEDKRCTAFGKKLRSTSLDELPELVNVLIGDMSIIGPRPLLIKYLPYYTIEERKRHNVRPGITGLAQITGRNFLGWNERFKLDIQYINSISFFNDMKILFITIKKVISHKDIVSYDQIPSELFGNLDQERTI